MSTPKRAGDAPKAIVLEEGKTYAWCACGLSETQPFCSGAHKTTDIKPVVFTVEKNETRYMCMCKDSKAKPFCDGSHND